LGNWYLQPNISRRHYEQISALCRPIKIVWDQKCSIDTMEAVAFAEYFNSLAASRLFASIESDFCSYNYMSTPWMLEYYGGSEAVLTGKLVDPKGRYACTT